MSDAEADADVDAEVERDGDAAARERSPLPVSEASELVDRVADNVGRVIVGNKTAVEHVLVTVLARGHLLLEDVPGVGKTMLARSLARSVDCEFKRVQFTPDLLPSDVTGINVYNQKSGEFEFQPGPVFANIVLGDEINRAPPKTQSALLEAMEEQQVTVDGVTRELPDPFTVIATQNDVEPGRTYELPMAEVDRFMKKLRLGYPDPADETEMLDRTAGRHPIESLDSVATTDQLRRARDAVGEVEVSEPVRSYVTDLATYTREHAQLGASPRGSIALVRASQARAVIDGRDYVVPDDVQTEVRSVFAHRVRPRTGGESGLDVVEDALSTVTVE
ncbi:AAA family ATPase [Halobaculum sp. CBA1158]|uniref:AAA family ATPase n=1 Tax=Halobaculum sp. CBA1158 TaxID=2904243 RepID=UPI001F187E0C|nr:AAA family ATPase [Halobaculum sp. CBA1158]UIO99673.1 AAA family ATPase [Halobaculum sp. CBA1158]